MKKYQFLDQINSMQQSQQLTISPSHPNLAIYHSKRSLEQSNRSKMIVGQILTQQSQSITQSKRKWKRDRTPSQILKENLLSTKRMRRANSLRLITQENLKLFMRLHQQKSNYDFNGLHKEFTSAILTTSKSKLSRDRHQVVKQNLKKNSESKEEKQCQGGVRNSTGTVLRFKCDSLKQGFKISSSNLKINTLAVYNSHIETLKNNSQSGLSIGKRRIQVGEKKDKENLIQINLEAFKSKEQSIICKKIGIKVPLTGKENKISALCDQNTVHKFESVKLRPQSSLATKLGGFLTERKSSENII